MCLAAQVWHLLSSQLAKKWSSILAVKHNRRLGLATMVIKVLRQDTRWHMHQRQKAFLQFLTRRHPEALFSIIGFLCIGRNGPPVHWLLKVPICITHTKKSPLKTPSKVVSVQPMLLCRSHTDGQMVRQKCLRGSRRGARQQGAGEAHLCWRCPASAP